MVTQGANGDYCLIGQDTVSSWYKQQVETGQLTKDPIQLSVVTRLQQLNDELVKAAEPSSLEKLAHWFGASDTPVPRSVYIHGSVGRGKSYLMDGFFLNVQRSGKLRVHFHNFMRRFHEDMKQHEDEDDALQIVADSLADKYSLLCFDEFHVSDIADAMVLGRILQILLDRGVVMVLTSNYIPNGLYPNGLARDRFIPTIKLIEERFDICELDGDIDYRLRTLSQADMYFSPNNQQKQEQFDQLFNNLALGMTLKPSIKVSNRRMPVVARTSDAIWFDFDEICKGNYGKNDYLIIAFRFATVFLSNVPFLDTEELAEASRRFTWLIDVLYDSKTKLAILADKPLTELYADEGGESGRTLSRLQEMQSKDYLSQAIQRPQGF